MSENISENEKNVEIEAKDTESDNEDISDLPQLEDINEGNDESLKNKTIRIEDKKEEKETIDGWLDVLDNGELKKFVITAGEVGKPRPERGCFVVIKLVTKLLETQEVVDSECFDSIDIVLGDSDVIQGLDLVIPLMDQKEVARVLIKSRFAFGKLGKGTEIPPDSTLDCEVHILSVEWPEEDMVLPIDERIRIGNRKKERGNFWFGRQEFSTSIQCYKSALKYLDATDEELNDNELKQHFDEKLKQKSSEESIPESKEKVNELIELRSNTYNNLAMAQMKIEAFDGALKSVEAVLICQPNNVKALFRRAKILSEKGELEEAIDNLRKALTSEPDNKTISQELSKYIAKRQKELKTEKDLYKRMLELDKPSNQSKGIDSISYNKWLKWSIIGGVATASLAVASALTYKFIQ